MSKKKQTILFGVIFVVSLILTIVCRRISDNQVVEFEEVRVTVVTSETRTVRAAGRNVQQKVVTVRYNSEIYELKNVHDTYMFRPGSTVTAYLAHGSLYANEEGVQTSTPIFYAYIGFLVAAFVFFILFVSFLPYLFRKVE